MFSALIVLASLGQIHASDGPPREWLPGVVDGKVVQLWGWRDASGGVRYFRAENHHLFPEHKPPAWKPTPQPTPTPTPPAKPLNTGILLESNGTLNSGLNLEGSQPGPIDTNDPAFGNRLGLTADCPGPGPCPKPDPDSEPDQPAHDPYDEYLIAGALVAGASLIAFAVGCSKRPAYPVS